MKSNSDIILHKMSGAGNTFVLLDFIQKNEVFQFNRSQLAKQICDPVIGVSADGFIVLEKSNDNKYVWDFYNNDGSTAEACGNASRCVSRYLIDLYESARGEVQFQTVVGIIQGRHHSDQKFVVNMPAIQDITPKQFDFSVIDSGVPHVVVEVDSVETFLDEGHLLEVAHDYRFHPELGKAGANISFYLAIGKSFLRAVTFERGVEGFTQACGTGAIAVAYVNYLKNKSAQTQVQMPGGLLEVDFSQSTEKPLLIGRADYVCEIRLNRGIYEVI